MVGEKQVMADKVWAIERQISKLQTKMEHIWEVSGEVEARVAKGQGKGRGGQVIWWIGLGG